MKLFRTVFLLSGFTAFLVVGFWVGGLLNRSHLPKLTEITPTCKSVDSESLYKFLLIFTDSLDSRNAHLNNVWAINFVSTGNLIYLKSMYPSRQLQGSTISVNTTLAENFSLQWNGKPDPGFLCHIQQEHFAWDAYLVTDREGTAAIIDAFGGINTNDGHRFGSEIVSNLQPEGEPSLDSLKIQTALADQLCEDTLRRAPMFDFSQISKLIPKHINASGDPLIILQRLQELLSLGQWKSCMIPEERPSFPIP